MMCPLCFYLVTTSKLPSLMTSIFTLNDEFTRKHLSGITKKSEREHTGGWRGVGVGVQGNQEYKGMQGGKEAGNANKSFDSSQFVTSRERIEMTMAR